MPFGNSSSKILAYYKYYIGNERLKFPTFVEWICLELLDSRIVYAFYLWNPDIFFRANPCHMRPWSGDRLDCPRVIRYYRSNAASRQPNGRRQNRPSVANFDGAAFRRVKSESSDSSGLDFARRCPGCRRCRLWSGMKSVCPMWESGKSAIPRAKCALHNCHERGHFRQSWAGGHIPVCCCSPKSGLPPG